MSHIGMRRSVSDFSYATTTNDDATHSFHFFLLAAVGGRQQRYSAYSYPVLNG